MKKQNNISLLKTLEQLPTSDLDAMLHSELEKELPDEQSILLILQVLRKREEVFPPVNNPQIDKAWNKYQQKKGKVFTISKMPLAKAATILILCSILLFMLPHKSNAEDFYNRAATWTKGVFTLFNKWSPNYTPNEYVFQTDHPGLQKLYNVVNELGVTTPVVPMWLNDEYQLDFLDVFTSPAATKVLANFVDDGREAVFELIIYSDNVPREFHKNKADVIIHESNGTIHYIFRNDNTWSLVWTTDNLECALSLECQDDEVYRIIDSIYSTEE